MQMKRLVAVVLALFVVAGFSFAAQAQEEASPETGEAGYGGSFDLERCVTRALDANPTILSARSQLQGADFGEKSKVGTFLPSVSGDYGYMKYDRKITNLNDRDQWTGHVNVSQPIFKGFSLLSDYQKSALTKDQSAAKLTNVELTVIKDVQSTFFQLLKARMDVKSAEDSVTRLDSQVKVISAFYEVGLKPKAEVLDAEVDLANARQTQLIAQNNVSIQEAQLNTLLNIPVEAEVDYVGELKQFPFGLDLKECLRRAYAARPDLMIGEKSVDIARKDAKIAASSFYPDVSFDYDYYKKGDDASLDGGKHYSHAAKEYWSLGVNMNMKVFEWGSDYYDYKRVAETITQLEAELDNLRLNAGFEVKQSLLNIKAASDRINVAKKSVEAAAEAYRMAVARYQAQVGTNTDVLNAQARLTEAEALLSQALSDYGTAVSSLYVAMGEKNPALVTSN